MLAYDVQESQIIGGPSWFSEKKWDIEAKSGNQAQHSVEETRRMLQNLLVGRFSLAIHRETRQLPVYVLGAAKGGPKFKVQEDDRSMNTQITGNSVRLKSGKISRFAQGGVPGLDVINGSNEAHFVSG